MPFLMLRDEWEGLFRCNVTPTKTLIFEPGIVSEVSEDEYDALTEQIGGPLLEFLVDDDDQVTPTGPGHPPATEG